MAQSRAVFNPVAGADPHRLTPEGEMTTLDLITLPPRIIGKSGLAWPVDLDLAYQRLGKSRADAADVASWLVEAPWAHPVWHSYWINLAHLRELPNYPRPKIYIAGATHEILVHALNPNMDRQTMIETGAMHALHPANFAAQFIEATDDGAIERIRGTVEMICDSKLSPDTDFRQSWVMLFGDNMLKE
jgi:hypothetical protein